MICRVNALVSTIIIATRQYTSLTDSRQVIGYLWTQRLAFLTGGIKIIQRLVSIRVLSVIYFIAAESVILRQIQPVIFDKLKESVPSRFQFLFLNNNQLELLSLVLGAEASVGNKLSFAVCGFQN